MSDDDEIPSEPSWVQKNRFPVFEELLERLQGVRDELAKEKERLEKELKEEDG